MDRSREARRAASMAAPPNGLSSSTSRRRHRSGSLRDSPDEDGGVELQEPGRLRDRGVIKKDRDRDRDRGDRERERERERERSSRSKRRRENRMMMHHTTTTGSNRDDGDDTSEESVNDEDEDEEDDGGSGGLRMLPPPPANPATTAMSANHHNHNHQLHRKSFPPSGTKVLRTAPPPPAWKAADEMIGVSVPRKARSASTKRSHDWISSSGVVGGGVEQIHGQSSTSPVRLVSSAVSPAPVAPLSPSSPNVSIRKKMKPNGGGSKPRPPKSSSKSSSSNPEELEIEIAEVLYGLMTQSQAPAKKEVPSTDSANKFDSNKSSSETKSRVSSPVSNSTVPPQNSSSLSAVAPKRKRPRQVSDNPFGVRSSPVSSSMKTEIDHHHHQSPKTEVSSPNLENNNSGSAAAAAENGGSFGFTSLPNHQGLPGPAAGSVEPPQPLRQPVVEEGKCSGGDVMLTKEEVKKESPAVRLDDENGKIEAMIATASSTTATNLTKAVTEVEYQREEKFEIDLMASPPQMRSSPERDGEIDFSDHKQVASKVESETSKLMKDKEDEKLKNSGKEEPINLVEEQKLPKAGILQEIEASSKKPAMNEEKNINLQLDLEKTDKECASMASGNSNRSQHQHHALKHHQPFVKPPRDEAHTEKTAQPNTLPLPISMAGWPPMGYVAPLQGVVSMDGSSMASTPVQPIFTQPRPKRCATHCYIARNINYLQQFMKINPFWPAAAGSAPIFGAKAHLNVMPSPELHGNIAGRALNPMQDKGQGIALFPSHTTGKDSKSSQATNVPDPAQRKQQILLQQALPPVTPNNILHGPAFIFPFNQQQAVAAAASVRPGSSKPITSTGGLSAASSAGNSTTATASTTSGATAMSFSYPNMPTNETQYLAILQNNGYTFPIPAVGAPPNYRGSPHAQAMPLFNGSFYSSQMIHPSQLQQQQQQAPPGQTQHPPSQSQQIPQAHQNSSSSTSSSQKHLQIQQRQQGGNAAVNGGGNVNMHNNYATHKNRPSHQPAQPQSHHINPPPPQARHLEHEVAGGEDSPSTADSRVSRAPATMSVYSHNYAMPVHHQNYALMNPQAALPSAASGNSNDKKQQQQQQQSQQQGLKRGMESSLPPQTFAMSFAPINGTASATGIDISSLAQNHAIIQSLPESLRQSYHQMMAAPAAAAAAHHAQQKKNFRISEETAKTGGHDSSSNVDDDRKGGAGMPGKSGQSIAFSRSDFSTDASGSSTVIPGSTVIDSSARNINLASNNRSSRSPMSSSVGATQSSHHLHAHQLQQQQQQQQMLQLHKQQQQNQHMAASLNARNKNPPTSNGNAYPEHLMTTSSMAAKFTNSLSSFPQNLVQTSNASCSPTQSPQWKNSVRGPSTSQVPSSLASSTTSSLKNLHQPQQLSRSHQQSHTQISFGASNQKLSSSSSSQLQQQNPNSNNSNQCPSPPMVVGSPTTSSISKGGGASGSPRTNASASTTSKTAQASSLSSSQQPKNSPVTSQRSSPSILGNPHMTNSSNAGKSPHQQQQQQQQLSKQTMQQTQLFYPNSYMQVSQAQAQQAQAQAQVQAQQHSGSTTTATGTSGYYLPRKQQNQQSSSTGMLSLCPPVTLASAATSDPAKAIAAAAIAANMKGGAGGLASQQGILHATQYGGNAAQSSNAAHQLLPSGFPQYVHTVPAAVQVKPAEQKQPAEPERAAPLGAQLGADTPPGGTGRSLDTQF